MFTPVEKKLLLPILDRPPDALGTFGRNNVQGLTEGEAVNDRARVVFRVNAQTQSMVPEPITSCATQSRAAARTADWSAATSG